MKTIIVATDGSAAANRAVDFGVDMAHAFAANLLIVTASELVGSSDLRKFGEAERAALGDILEAESRKVLAEARSIAEKKGFRDAGTQFRIGDAAKAILDAASDVRADVIVVGKRGRGHLAGLLLGSVSQKLVSLAPCAVVVVP